MKLTTTVAVVRREGPHQRPAGQWEACATILDLDCGGACTSFRHSAPSPREALCGVASQVEEFYTTLITALGTATAALKEGCEER